MKISLNESTPGLLRVGFGMTIGARIGISIVGLFFIAVGSLFLFSALPHTEFLRLERSLDGIACTRGQALAGRWVLSEETVAMNPGCKATFEWITDEGETQYRMLIAGSAGFLYFGKTKSSLEAAKAVADRINEFLVEGFETRLEWSEEFWWWYLAPFGLLAWAVGLFALGLGNYRDAWSFSRLTGEAVRTTRAIIPLRHRRLLLSDVSSCKTVKRIDSDGDTSVNLALVLRTGEETEMSSVSHYLRDTASADEAASRINAFILYR